MYEKNAGASGTTNDLKIEEEIGTDQEHTCTKRESRRRVVIGQEDGTKEELEIQNNEKNNEQHANVPVALHR